MAFSSSPSPATVLLVPALVALELAALELAASELGARSVAQAQSIRSAADGTRTRVNQVGDRYDIDGGRRSGDGANLFHSFEAFGLSQAEIANFIANPETRNILGRVVGGDVSLVDGLIQVTGGNANLFLMNPAGIVFGPNARLDVPADFTATSATGIGLGDGWFSAAGENDYADLVGDPDRLAFGTLAPGAVINAGTLQVGDGQHLTLAGGVTLNTGTLTAPGGTITLAAVPGETLVRITQDGFLLSLEVEPLSASDSQPNEWTLPVASLPELLTGGGTGSGIGGATDLTVNPDGSVTLVGSGLTVPTEPGTVVAAGSFDTQSAAADPSGVTIQGDRVLIANPTAFATLDSATRLRVEATDTVAIAPLADAGVAGDLIFSPGRGSVQFTAGGAFTMRSIDTLRTLGRNIEISARRIRAGAISTFRDARQGFFPGSDDERFPRASGDVTLTALNDIDIERIWGEDVTLTSRQGDIRTGSISSEADTFIAPEAFDANGNLLRFDGTTLTPFVDANGDPVQPADLENLDNVFNTGEGSRIILSAPEGVIRLDGFMRAGKTNKTTDSAIVVEAQRFRVVNPLTVFRNDEAGNIIGGSPDAPTSLYVYGRNTDPPGRNSPTPSVGATGRTVIQFGAEGTFSEPDVIGDSGPILIHLRIYGDETFTIGEPLDPRTSGIEGGIGIGGRRDPSVNPVFTNLSFVAPPEPPPAPTAPNPVPIPVPVTEIPLSETDTSLSLLDNNSVADQCTVAEQTADQTDDEPPTDAAPILDVTAVLPPGLTRSPQTEIPTDSVVSECFE